MQFLGKSLKRVFRENVLYINNYFITHMLFPPIRSTEIPEWEFPLYIQQLLSNDFLKSISEKYIKGIKICYEEYQGHKIAIIATPKLIIPLPEGKNKIENIT